MPLGEPVLAWSFNHDGEALPELTESMEKRVGANTREKRTARQDLVGLARPQEGVDALQGRFGRATKSIPGVVPESPDTR